LIKKWSVTSGINNTGTGGRGKRVEDGVEMTFLCSRLEYMSHWLLIWGNSAKIRKNEQVKKRVCKLVEQLYQHYFG